MRVKSPGLLKLLKPEKSAKEQFIFSWGLPNNVNLFSESPTSTVVSSSFVLKCIISVLFVSLELMANKSRVRGSSQDGRREKLNTMEDYYQRTFGHLNLTDTNSG